MTENLEQKASFGSFIDRLKKLRREYDSKELDADATFIELARLDEEFEKSPYYDNESLADQFYDIHEDLYNECSEEMEFSDEIKRIKKETGMKKITPPSINMEYIGFTTGCLYRSDIPFEETIGLFHSLGADAVELSFATPGELLKYQLSGQMAADIKKYAFISIHAPWKEARYDSSSTADSMIEKLRSLCRELPVEGIVLHPDTISDFEKLDKSGLLFLLENMDRRKKCGIYPEEFEKLKEEYSFGFVLDTQHAYEHDPNMNLAKELIDAMGDRLKHMHVSGCAESEIHVPVHLAANKEAITKILELGINVPKILEGILLEDIEKTIKNELEYAGKYKRK